MRGVYGESKQEAYDAIVVGAGLGGLSLAALLARAGRSVLVVERHDRPGGYAHSFKRRGFHFDAGVHLVSGCGQAGYRNGSVIHKISRAAGIDPQALFLPLASYAQAVFPGLSLPIRSGEEDFVAALAEPFPAEKDRLLDLVRLCRSLAEEAMLAEELLEQSQTAAVSPAASLAGFFRYRRASLADVLQTALGDERLRGVCAALWPYLGLPPSKLSFLYWANMMAGYIYEGGYYCRGTFQSYANHLANGLARQGGELLLNASVRRICVEQGQACGVMLENGQRIRAKAVVSNVDARQTAELLVGKEHLPAGHWDGLMKLKPSLSAFVAYVATDLPLPGHAHESFFYDSFDHEASFAHSLQGRFGWFSATLPSLADPSLAPAGRHVMLLTTLCPGDIGRSWRQAKPEYQQRLLEQAERRFPGLNQRLLLLESGSPRTLERYTLNHQGAAYGFAPTPNQVGPNRPGARGALPGLYQVGHWTRPGGGVAGVSISAMLAAQAMLGIPRQGDFWRFLGVE